MFNLPNALTMSRLVLAVAYFWLLTIQTTTSLVAAVAVFLVAGLTDVLDGWLARRWKIATAFGRMADPLIDKILICGGFIFFWKTSEIVQFWMVLVIVGRELVVTAMRFIVESTGTQFAATFFGKAKMLVQFITLLYLPLYIAYGRDSSIARVGALALVWLAVVVTALSAVPYLFRACFALKGTPPHA